MIIVKLKGGMGNQMFQYAFARSLASKYNVDFKLDVSHFWDHKSLKEVPREYGLHKFNIIEKIASKNEISKYVLFTDPPKNTAEIYIKKIVNKIYKRLNAKYVIEPDVDKYNEEVLKEDPADRYFDGNWITEKYFTSIRDVIRKDFSFKYELPEEAKQIAEYISQVDSVCVHVRRTDFLNDVRQISISPEDINKGLTYLKKRDISPVVFVFSDDPKWCRENLMFDYPAIFISEENAGSDADVHFQLMRLCHYFIISVSTFGWWAAWLSTYPNKVVLHPHNYNSTDWSAEGWIDLSTLK
ncbi:MAG: hypothetical protein JWR67_2038 [Mucilaginibacter sp.]|nr:hypothetical protein [Mucilaginibacter sp.]